MFTSRRALCTELTTAESKGVLLIAQLKLSAETNISTADSLSVFEGARSSSSVQQLSQKSAKSEFFKKW